MATPKLGSTVSFRLDPNHIDLGDESVSQETLDKVFRARVVAVATDSGDEDTSFYIGLKDGQVNDELEDLHYTLVSNDFPEKWKTVSNISEYCNTISNKDIFWIEKETKMMKLNKAMIVVKDDAKDAAWRKGVEKVVELGHKQLASTLSKSLGVAKSKPIVAFLSTDVGRHALAFGLGVALDFAPSEDERLTRLAKELRVYGMEIVFGFAFDQVSEFVPEALKCLPKL